MRRYSFFAINLIIIMHEHNLHLFVVFESRLDIPLSNDIWLALNHNNFTLLLSNSYFQNWKSSNGVGKLKKKYHKNFKVKEIKQNKTEKIYYTNVLQTSEEN